LPGFHETVVDEQLLGLADRVEPAHSGK
jgi:hypothetical protein